MSNPKSLTVSVVICSYSLERWNLLARAIESLRAQSSPVDEIIVVVDHNDLLLERTRKEFNDVVVVPNIGPTGLSGARNSGVGAATGEIVVFLDDDAEAARECVKELLPAYRDQDVLGVGGRVIPRFEHARPAWLPPEFDWVIGCTYEGHRSSRGPLRNMIGANMSMRRTVFEKIGEFRTDLGRTESSAAGCEETELCVRATAVLGGAVWYEPGAVATHFVPNSRTTFRYFARRCFDEGRSKAVIARITDRAQGLSSERRYMRVTIPRAVLRESFGTLVFRPGAWRRLGALVAGVTLTTLGFARGRVERAPAHRGGPTPFDPVFVTTIDSETPNEIAPGNSSHGRPYPKARALTFSRGRPVADIEFALPPSGLPAAVVEELLASVRAPVATADSLSTLRLDGPPPFVSVVIATRDRESALLRCLRSIQQLEYENFEVIVVDNASSSLRTSEVVEAFAAVDGRFHYVREDVPGLANAHNCGVRNATGDFIAFTDDDVVVHTRWLTALVEAFGSDPSIACVTGLIYPSEIETLSQAWTEEWLGLNKGFERRRFRRDTPPDGDPLFPYAPGAFGSGANMAARADFLRSQGGFDPALGVGTPARGGDDLALFVDVLLADRTLVYEPAAVVFHTHRREYAGLERQAYGYGVGLGAYLTHVVTRHPAEIATIARRAPKAARYFLSNRSPKNIRRPEKFPRELLWRERFGLLAGPWNYARSCLKNRRQPVPINIPDSSRRPVSIAAEAKR